MIQHSMIIDEFFKEPELVRKILLKQQQRHHMASDGVNYPGIIELPQALQEDISDKLDLLFSNRASVNLCFGRYSMEDMAPPNWAHSDYNMAKMVALIYMNLKPYPWDGTHFVRHKRLGFEIHPDNEEKKDALIQESNWIDKWEITYTCPARFNRAFIFDARYLHAAATKYGDTNENSRLVLTAFFELT